MSRIPIEGWSRPLTLTGKLMRIDWRVITVAAMIASIGTATLYSVAGGSFEPLAERHAMRFLVGAAMVLSIALMPPRALIAMSYPAYAAALVLLALVPFIGTDALGARRWLSIANLSFQPAELMKVALVAALARYYQWLSPGRISKPLWVAIPLAMIALPVLLTLKQPDLGTSLLFIAIGIAIMFLAGVSWWLFAAGGAAMVIAVPHIWDGLHGYQKKRIETFLDPDKDPLGAGYHITQSKIALGSGGMDGRGYMQGTQSQLEFLPEKHTDFAFTMFAEEWGFIGSVALLALYATLLNLMMAMAMRATSQFGRLAAAGFAVTLFTYVFINVAMVTGLVPVVGVPLPLMSYGGTAMMSLMAALGLAMSAHVHRKELAKSPSLGPFW